MLFLTIISALLLDRFFGEPTHHHPLVGFGTVAGTLEKKLNRPNCSEKVLFFGLISVSILISLPVGAYFLIEQAVSHYAWLSNLFDIVVLYLAIGNQSLKEHVKDVRDSLIKGDLHLARQYLAKIVSRDVEQCQPEQIITGTIETNLENGSDAVFAPIFWFICAGAPGVIVYRLCNTLDAMWGYRTNRFEYFGKPTALIDDILNYIPARLVALSYALAGNTKLSLNCWRKQAQLLSSPNAGPVMTAGAGSLNIRLGGPTTYHGKMVQKPYFGTCVPAKLIDIDRSNTLISRVVLIWVLTALAISSITLLDV
ncbi:adenosylcobinamide-phosphate synthase CbiB [Arenicella sp. 4NH20-0111]|uniref:adenosylcobinamide-phosphate synthase CbiB n=1 Tax=Arenicella sp. 4NH20-0111 TaxID=3127648 RepID=UPI0033407564